MSEKQRLIDLANKRIMHLRFMQEAKTPVGVTPRGGVQFDNSDSIALLEAALAHLSAEPLPLHEATDWQVEEAVARMVSEGDMVLVPRGVLGAAMGAIRHPLHEAGVTIGLLRHFAYQKKPAAKDPKCE